MIRLRTRAATTVQGSRPAETARQGGGASAAAVVRVCGAFAAAGHPQRATILRMLLDGPATYRALRRVTRAKAGPLYHHINQLRLAGLLRPKQRDLYELTRGGRNLLLVLAVAARVIRDRRRRP
ncbi:MAG: winged helix-turn-helix transcriptional regulator [Planctomycetes bacterium]|nr:winged helix-turn-helix transcriptional regulator [Planctomycetota bacterium]